MRRLPIAVVAACLFACATPARADLIDLGNGMIYDSVQDLTWMQDAMYARTSGADADGLMEWYEAEAFASNLQFGGYDDWRLPARLGSYQLLENSSEVARLVHQLGWVATPQAGASYSVVGGVGPFLNFQNPGIDMYWFGSGAQRYWHEILIADFGDPAAAWVVRDGRAAASAVVPEPTAFMLLALGIPLLIVAYSRQRNRRLTDATAASNPPVSRQVGQS